jgi:putative ABC transport system permease protein
MGALLQDIRYGIRTLAESPGFAAIAILTLALGIGANTAIFSAVDAILLRPLPYQDSARLVHVLSTLAYFPGFNLGNSPADISDIQAGNHVFENLAMHRSDFMNLTGGGEPEESLVGLVSADLFSVMGVQPALGRPFITEEQQPEKGNVAILSDSLWRRRFGSNPDIVGKLITLNAKSYEVVGVMPPGFRFPAKTDLWLPLALTDKELHEREMHGTMVLTKLKPGVQLPQAQAELNTIATRLAKDYADVDEGLGLKVQLLQEETVGQARPALLVLLGAVGFVLLIACANVGNLALARALKRQKEMGIRAALGASRRRIVRLLLTESLVLALAGGVLGMVFAWWGIDALRRWAPADTPRLDELHVHAGILWFSITISILAGVLFGLFPALQSSQPDLNSSLKDAGTSSSASFGRSRLRSALVVAELALALVLLAGSALTIESLARLTRVNPGFRTDHLLAMSVHLPSSKYPESSQQLDFMHQSLDKMKSIPGVESVAAGSNPVLHGKIAFSTLTIEGTPKPSSPSGDNAQLNGVTPDYFQTMGMRLIAGRSFTNADARGSLLVAVVNEALARHYWPDRNVVGKRISLEVDKASHPIWIEVVGVANDTRDIHLNAAPKPEVFLPYFQHPQDSISFYLRTSQAPASLAPAAQSQIWSVDKDQPVADISTMEAQISQNVAEPKFRTFLLGIFSALGLLLTLIGIYGVMSYSVSQRTHEIGIRLALGAQPRDVLGDVLWDGAKLTFAGLAIGLIAALALTRLLASLLFEIRATDPATFTSVVALLAAVALAACYFPARRATRVDPLVALRHE